MMWHWSSALAWRGDAALRRRAAASRPRHLLRLAEREGITARTSANT
jgi:hypothetical protein